MPTEPRVPHLALFFVFVVLPLTLGFWAIVQARSEVDKRARIVHAIICGVSTVGGLVGAFVLGAL